MHFVYCTCALTCRYPRGIQSHSIPCGLGSRVRPLRGRLLPIKVAKLLPSASAFRFCECSCMGGRELDEFPWGLSGSDDTSMTQMVMRSFVTGGSGCSWLLRKGETKLAVEGTTWQRMWGGGYFWIVN